MAELRSQDKRDKLRLLYARIESTKKPLNDLLMEALKNCDDAINGVGGTPGTWLSSTAENGGSASFSALYDYSPVVAKRLIGEMLDAYDLVSSRFEKCEKPGEKDHQIYHAMMRYFKPIRRFRSDFTGGRYGVGISLGT